MFHLPELGEALANLAREMVRDKRDPLEAKKPRGSMSRPMPPGRCVPPMCWRLLRSIYRSTATTRTGSNGEHHWILRPTPLVISPLPILIRAWW